MDPTAEVPQWVRTVAGLLFLFALAVGAFLLYQRKLQRLTKFARKHGMTFLSDEDVSLNVPSRFAFHNDGHMGSFPGLLRVQLSREERDVTFTLGEYCYADPKNEGAKGYPVWIAMVSDPALDLPAFTLRPESWTLRIRDHFRGDDIDLEHSPTFSRRFRLAGSDQAATRALFTRELCTFMEQCRGYRAEGMGDTLILYRPPHMLRPTGFSERRARTLLRLIRSLHRILSADPRYCTKSGISSAVGP